MYNEKIIEGLRQAANSFYILADELEKEFIKQDQENVDIYNYAHSLNDRMKAAANILRGTDE